MVHWRGVLAPRGQISYDNPVHAVFSWIDTLLTNILEPNDRLNSVGAWATRRVLSPLDKSSNL